MLDIFKKEELDKWEIEEWLYKTLIDIEFTNNIAGEFKYTQIVCHEDNTWYFFDTRTYKAASQELDYEFYMADNSLRDVFDIFYKNREMNEYELNVNIKIFSMLNNFAEKFSLQMLDDVKREEGIEY